MCSVDLIALYIHDNCSIIIAFPSFLCRHVPRGRVVQQESVRPADELLASSQPVSPNAAIPDIIKNL